MNKPKLPKAIGPYKASPRHNLAWKFLRDDMRSGMGDEPVWEVGVERTHPGPYRICESGYHASSTPSQALEYAHGNILALVEVGPVKDYQEDKVCVGSMKVLRAVNMERALHLLACDIAEDALLIFEKEHPSDKRPRQAIEAKRKWLDGTATNAELAAARDAVRNAVWAAASYAAWAAARAEARGAVKAAAWAAAWDEPQPAARAAAWAKYAKWGNDALTAAAMEATDE